MAKVGRVTLYLYVQVSLATGKTAGQMLICHQLPLIAIIAYVVFGDPMKFTSLVGSSIIIASAVAVTLSKEQKEDTKVEHGARSEYRPLELEGDEGGEELPLERVQAEKAAV